MWKELVLVLLWASMSGTLIWGMIFAADLLNHELICPDTFTMLRGGDCIRPGPNNTIDIVPAYGHNLHSDSERSIATAIITVGSFMVLILMLAGGYLFFYIMAGIQKKRKQQHPYRSMKSGLIP